MRAKQPRIQPDAPDPLRYEPRILARCYGAVRTAAAREQELPGPFAAGLRLSSIAWRVCSLNSNLTGRPVFFCRTIARSAVYPPAATSSTRMATRSQPRSLLSIARLNRASSRVLSLVPWHSLRRGGRIHLILHGHTPSARLQRREGWVSVLSIGIWSVFEPKRTPPTTWRQTPCSD
jgi:hypothetical protein